jgi:hypothetical protein
MTDLDRIHKLRVACRMAANTFRRYEQIHLNKGTPDGKTKAQENSDQAAYLEKALRETEVALTGCTKPPDGWRCTRPKGHDGPCAAVPIL